MLPLCVAIVVASPTNTELFATLGLSSHGFPYSDGDSTFSGAVVGGGVAIAMHPTSTRFAFVPRLDVQVGITGDARTNAQLALLLGKSWEHFRPTIGPSFQLVWDDGNASPVVGLSADFAFFVGPLVLATFADAGVLAAGALRAGVRVGISL